MRGGVRLPALAVVIGLLAGCSDPAGAVRRKRASVARTASPSPIASASPTASAPKKPVRHAATWWQAPSGVKTATGLRVRAGELRANRLRVTVTDVGGRTSRVLVVTRTPRTATVGRYALTGVKVAPNPRTGAYGLTFRYHRR